jgi:hypothetical protein
MAFKMKGFPKISNPKDFARRQKLKAGGKLKSEHEDTAVTGESIDGKIYDLEQRISFLQENESTYGRPLTNEEKADIASMRNELKTLRKNK